MDAAIQDVEALSIKRFGEMALSMLAAQFDEICKAEDWDPDKPST